MFYDRAMKRPALKKTLGQHHLRDGRLCEPLLEALDAEGQDVVEIGPGGGILTAELLRVGARVLACELNTPWAVHLRERFDDPDLRITVVDALNLDWRRFPAGTMVTGNLPFNVGTAIIERMLPHHANIPRAAFMVQKEVAERMTAKPREKTYGSFSVIVAAYAKVRYLGTIKPGSFHPPPKVAAAYVGLRLRPPPLADELMPDFCRWVRMAFAKRRKTLRNSLSSGIGRERAEAVLAAADIAPRTRAEELELATFVRLFEEDRKLGEAI